MGKVYFKDCVTLSCPESCFHSDSSQLSWRKLGLGLAFKAALGVQQCPRPRATPTPCVLTAVIPAAPGAEPSHHLAASTAAAQLRDSRSELGEGFS